MTEATEDRFKALIVLLAQTNTGENGSKTSVGSPVHARCSACARWLASIAGFALKYVVLMTARTSFRKDCVKVGNWFVPDEYPDFEAPVIDSGKYEGVFGVGGLILARIPVETIAERNEYFAQRNADQNASG